jgi:transposase
MARVEVIAGAERRRSWSEEQKRAIVAESLAPGAIVSEVTGEPMSARGQIYRSRQEFGTVAKGFTQVLIAPLSRLRGQQMARPAASRRSRSSLPARCGDDTWVGAGGFGGAVLEVLARR